MEHIKRYKFFPKLLLLILTCFFFLFNIYISNDLLINDLIYKKKKRNINIYSSLGENYL